MSVYNRLVRRNWSSTSRNSQTSVNNNNTTKLDHVYCSDHSRRTLINRQKVFGRKRPQDYRQKCIEDLSHYKRPKTEPSSSSSMATSAPPASTSTTTGPPKVMLLKPDEDNKSGFLESPEKKEVKVEAPPPPPKEPEMDPFVILSASVSNPKTYDGSELESEDEEIVLQSWRGDGDSDAESIDSDMDNPLKHAGGYSAEEVIRIMRDKLIRLQKSYIDQFQRLQYLLKEERRNYKHKLRREKETMMSIHQQPKPSPEEKAAYSMIKSLNHYNKARGKDAVFAASVKEKRLKATEGTSYKPSRPLPKCTFNITSNMKCGEVVIPLTKYCIKHIMEDTNQILFRPCRVVTEADEAPCENPIVDTFEGNTCVYHTPMAPLYSQVPEDSSTSQLMMAPVSNTINKVEPIQTSSDLLPEQTPMDQSTT